MHKKLETIALVTKYTNACIEILNKEVSTSNDEDRVKSAYNSLLEIYLQSSGIDKCWLPLFKNVFEIAIADTSTRNHVKKFNKYLKILNNLKENELLLKKSQEMLRIYPREYIPLEFICRVFAETYEQTDFNFSVS